jgi:hypothetical protein
MMKGLQQTYSFQLNYENEQTLQVLETIKTNRPSRFWKPLQRTDPSGFGNLKGLVNIIL